MRRAASYAETKKNSAMGIVPQRSVAQLIGVGWEETLARFEDTI